MKKLIGLLSVAMLFLFVTPSQAQLNFGVKTGLNLSKLDISADGLSGDNKAGWFIGPMAEFTVPIIGIGADAAFLYQTNKIGADSYSKTLNSFEIPINLKYSFGIGSYAGAFINVGPQFGFNVGKKNSEDIRLKDNTTTFNVGAGAKLIKHIQLGVNYNFALSNTAYFYDGKDKIEAKNNSWQIYLAYMF